MSDVPDAIKLLADAEAGLRSLMARALAEHRYQDMAEVAPLAEALAKLSAKRIPQEGNGAPTVLVEQAVAAKTETAPLHPVRESTSKQQRRASADEYPRFERDGDKLVKVGWSKKDRREYEHRAPRAAVTAVANKLTGHGRPGKVFSMDDLLPFSGGGGEEIPSYQAYLALAWFRQIGAVEQRGKDGYAVVGDSLATTRVADAWDNLVKTK